MTTQRAILFLLLLVLPSLLAIAQPVIEPITQNPNAVLLRRIWMVRGQSAGEDYVGSGCGPVGDINGDSITDFAVYYGKAVEWRVFLGGSPAPTTEPIWKRKTDIGLTTPVYGDFYGNGSHLVGFGDFIPVNQGATRAPQIRLFPVEDGILKDSAHLVLDMYSRSKIRMGMDVVIGQNTDGEAGDELIIANGGVRRQEPFIRIPEVWFYRGGSGFQVDTPSYIVYDTEPTRSSSSYTAQIVDLDGDRHFDLVTVGHYAEGYKLKLWFGTETSPWTWTKPDREITLNDDLALSTELAISDLDGDRKPDLASATGYSTNRGLYVFLSRNGFNPRTASFTRSEAHRLLTDSTLIQAMTLPPWNDTTRRVAMLGAIRPGVRDGQLLAFSGSGTGPNGAYDGYYSASQDGLTPGAVFLVTAPLKDVNDDGWMDQINSYFGWFGNNAGIAMILAGGPYIPLDQPTVGVRTEPMADHQRGLYLWPNPATTELNIAWRGDLSAMPTRLAIHDLSGKVVAESVLRPELGSARWATDGVASGRYLLTVYDRSGKLLASTSVVVQN
ncbi:MAG: hypothetical protein JNJ94_09910 [Chlorobi bacterium]|nr:hypothetical protein [Chlorobiota bacterium]